MAKKCTHKAFAGASKMLDVGGYLTVECGRVVTLITGFRETWRGVTCKNCLRHKRRRAQSSEAG